VYSQKWIRGVICAWDLNHEYAPCFSLISSIRPSGRWLDVVSSNGLSSSSKIRFPWVLALKFFASALAECVKKVRTFRSDWASCLVDPTVVLLGWSVSSDFQMVRTYWNQVESEDSAWLISQHKRDHNEASLRIQSIRYVILGKQKHCFYSSLLLLVLKKINPIPIEHELGFGAQSRLWNGTASLKESEEFEWDFISQ